MKPVAAESVPPLVGPSAAPRRPILIVFPDEWLAYSSTVLNLAAALSVDSAMSMLAFEGDFCEQKPALGNVHYLRVPHFLRRLTDRISRLLRVNAVPWLKVLLLGWAVWRLRPRPVEVIAVDPLAAWTVQKVLGHCHLLSLEVRLNDHFLRWLKLSRIDSVIIQTEDRYRFLFPRGGPICFLVQNAPTYEPLLTPLFTERRGLIFCGTAKPRFGINVCLEFLEEHPELQMTVQGLVDAESRRELESHHGHLLTAGRLILNQRYLDSAELLRYLTNFRVGFCFYDFRYLSADESFNYHTGPAGKLFNYFAAGVPVVALDIPGLSPVKTFEAGVVIVDLSPSSIHDAIRAIEADYDRMSANCLEAARHFSFNRTVEPYRQFLRARGTVFQSP